MKVLFVHDGPIFVNDEGNYYANFINDSIRLRYLHLGNSLSIITRVKKLKGKESDNFSSISSENFKVIEIPDYKSIINFVTLQLKALKIISGAVQSHDIIIVRLPSSSPSYAIKAAKRYGKPVLAEVVACSWDVLTNHSLLGKLMAPWYSYKLWRNARSLKHTLYVTNKFLQNRYPTKGKSIGCSDVILGQYDENVLLNKLQKIKNRGKDKPIYMATIGTLGVAYKGQMDVLLALKELKKQGKLFYYKLVGQGDASRLKNAIKEYNLEKEVEVIGPINHNEIFNFIDAIDLYIHPSRTEGLPRAPLEAMSRACPIIGSNAGGTPELLDKNTMFDKGNINKIIELLNNVDERFLLQEAKRAFERSKAYSFTKLELKRFTFYKEFLLDNNLPVLPKLTNQITKLSQV